MTVKFPSPAKILPYLLLAAVVVGGWMYLQSQLNAKDREAANLRRRLALADSTRELVDGSFGRMALELENIQSSNEDLNQALADSGRKIVFLAQNILIITDSVDHITGLLASVDTLGPIDTLGGDFVWGPEEVSLGFVQGSVFCPECIRFPPTVDVTFRPKPLDFDIGLTAHKELPWEVFVTLNNLDQEFRVEISQPPVIADWLREASEPPCRRKLLGFLPSLCDALFEGGAGLVLAQDVTFPVGGWAQGSVGIGTPKFRLTAGAIVSQRSVLYVGPAFRFR